MAERQILLFENETDGAESKYSGKVEAPIYEPSHTKPHLMLLCDTSKTRKMIREIDAAPIPEDEKEFLRAAAWRHAVFHYERIADYYAHSAKPVQNLMEKSALVIIDFDAAIERGFVQLCEDIRTQYLEEYIGDE